MSASSSRVAEYVQDRRHCGQLAGALVGRSSLAGQPPNSTIYLRIENGVLREGRYQTSGCGFLAACCGAVIDLCLGRALADCLGVTPQHVADYLGGLPDQRRYCAELAVDALRDALGAALRAPLAEGAQVA